VIKCTRTCLISQVIEKQYFLIQEINKHQQISRQTRNLGITISALSCTNHEVRKGNIEEIERSYSGNAHFTRNLVIGSYKSITRIMSSVLTPYLNREPANVCTCYPIVTNARYSPSFIIIPDI